MNQAIWIISTVLALAVLLFLPKIGLLAVISSRSELRKREKIEDALKHLLDREQMGRHATPESLAGTLGLSPSRVIKLITSMGAQSLIEHRGSELHLTSKGEHWALHIVRAHRLWERYLADEARMPLEKVHVEAHRREHELTPTQIDELDAALGHPSFDPHGDPIPTKDGQLPTSHSVPLTDWNLDKPGLISHLEDEPPLAYAQILAAGLRLGQTIRILETTAERYILSDGENEYRLAPAVAANVYIEPLPDLKTMPAGVVSLIELQRSQNAEIFALDDSVQGFTRRRFLDLGLTPGTNIYPELQNFFGDPRAYRVRGTLIALRKDQAALIWVKPIENIELS